MATAVAIAVADHCRQGGGFARAGSADEDDKSTLGHGQILDHVGQVQLVHVRDLGLDSPQHHAADVALVKGANPEAANTAGTQGVVALVGILELGELLF